MHVDDAGGGAPERGGGAHLGLLRPDEVGADELEALDAVGASPGEESMQLGLFVRSGRDDELSDERVGDVVFLAEREEGAAALDAEAGLEGAGRVVEAGVEDLRVARGDTLAGLVAGVEDGDRVAAAGERERGREAGDAGADDDGVPSPAERVRE
jgi:hypothetical protein